MDNTVDTNTNSAATTSFLLYEIAKITVKAAAGIPESKVITATTRLSLINIEAIKNTSTGITIKRRNDST